ncbi:tetraspanin-18B [Onthophagus taurus]|uniref:tetraspanin-18B n=1 Tax=Onthophagus taurus TaxID=166361 RepID=UPI000C205CCD|nr:tetraspanin-11 [Onthophagus taurus]
MVRVSLGFSKGLLAFFNFLLLACGCTLISGGLLVLFDPERVLLSRLLSSGTLTTLSHPLLYYLGLGLVVLGLILSGTGLLGCWASCLISYSILTVYFLFIIVVLVGECGIYAIAWAWPQCLGLGMIPEELTKSLQRSYGVAGQEQFTAAIDLAQTLFKCCGIQSSIEYETSVWRLQSLGPSLNVPLTCCKLENTENIYAYLNPKPLNGTLCQFLDKDLQQGFRHFPGCSEHLEHWYKEQYIIFLGVGLIVVLIEFTVLLCTILACTKIYKSKHAKHQNETKEESNTLKSLNRCKDDDSLKNSLAYTNDVYTLSSSFRQNYKTVDRA